jgi:very-short-patch-repair endonuclease
MFFLIIIGIMIFGIIAAALIKPKKLTEAEKRERARERMLERDKAEREKIELKAKQKVEEESKAKAEAEEESKAKAEAEVKTEVQETPEETAELEKKPLEEVIKGKIRKSRPLTMNEQPMFSKLRETLEPEYVVLAQVSFGAILWTWSKAVRNRFNRKIVDFVVCDKSFNVIAVVELDDSSHKGKEEKDAERDLLFKEAGITVLRYKFTPESSKIREDIKTIK